MYAVVAVYPNGFRVLVGFAHTQADVDGLISDCITTNGEDLIRAAGIRFCVELGI